MFPSNNHSNPFSYTASLFGQSTSPYNENPSSSGHDEEPLSLSSHFPFSFPSNNDLILDHLVPQKQLTFGATGLPHESEAATDINAVITNNTNTEQMLEAQPHQKKNMSTVAATNSNPRKRTGKKDRHSKIYTSRGPRDRRMRLSLPISRAFFDLQDMLGFDKASKTIEWLLTKSKAAIEELVSKKQLQMKNSGGLINGELSMSQCLALALQTEQTTDTKDRKGMITEGEKLRTGSPGSGNYKKINSSKASHSPLARECRDKARARARERTRQKMMIRGLEKSKHPFTDTLQAGEERSSSHDYHKDFPFQLVAEVEETSSPHSLQHNQMATDHDIMENFFGIPVTSYDPCSLHHLPNTTSISGGLESNNFFSNFRGNCWDINSTRINSDCRAVKNKVSVTGNYAHDQTLSSIFMTTSDIQFQPQF